MIWVAPFDFDSSKHHYNYGWYFFTSNATLYSGPPHNYSGKATQFKAYSEFMKISNEIKIIVDTKNGNFIFYCRE